MKKLILFLSFFIYSVTSPCQQIPNGGLELWDTVAIVTPDPVHWLYNFSFFCVPNPITVERTSDANSGNWAAKVEAKFCYDESGIPRVYIGFLFVGDHPLYPDLGFGMYYSDRPDFLNFYYKFNKVGTDTAVAGVILRQYDSTAFGTIIGEGKASIINDVNSYTFLSVPITYFSTDTPGVLQVYFSTSKTITDQSFYFLDPTPGNGAYAGTTLWIDDVTVSGGSVGTPQLIDINNFQIYPNPTNDKSIVKFNNLNFGNYSLQLYNAQGKLVKYLNNISSQEIILERENLNRGMYFFQIKNNNDIIHSGKWVIN